MADLKTTYCGLELKTPIIAGSCGITVNADSAKKIEEAGAGAIVLKSLFEEQILMDADSVIESGGSFNEDVNSQDYISYYVKQNTLTEYIQIIKEIKKTVTIPVIASINCSTAGSWTSFARTIEEAGADGLEINVYIIPDYYDVDASKIEKRYMEIIKKIIHNVKIPVMLKLTDRFTTLAGTLIRLSKTDINGLVLFNRFLGHDISLNKNTLVTSNHFSTPAELSLPITWIGRLSRKLECDIAASTGIHDGDGVIKALLAGATAVQTVSVLYKNGIGEIQKMVERLNNWMDENGYRNIAKFRGSLDMHHIDNPQKYEREQFMQYRSDHDSPK
jgi:dihydroorotate dehydrogenase (fumarate)